MDQLAEIILAPCSQAGWGPAEGGRRTKRVPLRLLPPTSDRLDAIRIAVRTARPTERLLVHDLERPQSGASISAAIAASAAGTVVTCVNVKSTFKRVAEGVVQETVSRDSLAQLQGPWVFGREAFEEAVGTAVAEDWRCTDEITLARRAGMPVKLVAIEPFTPQFVIGEEFRATGLGPWEACGAPA